MQIIRRLGIWCEPQNHVKCYFLWKKKKKKGKTISNKMTAYSFDKHFKGLKEITPNSSYLDL